MWREAAEISACCVLYISMGLHDAVVRVTGIDLRVTGCPKCASFWLVLAWCLISGYGIIQSVFAAFILAYCALWVTLALDIMSSAYNRIYYELTKTTDTEEAQADEPAEADDPAVS